MDIVIIVGTALVLTAFVRGGYELAYRARKIEWMSASMEHWKNEAMLEKAENKELRNALRQSQRSAAELSHRASADRDQILALKAQLSFLLSQQTTEGETKND